MFYVVCEYSLYYKGKAGQEIKKNFKNKENAIKYMQNILRINNIIIYEEDKLHYDLGEKRYIELSEENFEDEDVN